MQAAGLLTYSVLPDPSRTLKMHSGIFRQPFCWTFESLQQRELSGNFTRFPINSVLCGNRLRR